MSSFIAAVSLLSSESISCWTGAVDPNNVDKWQIREGGVARFAQMITKFQGTCWVGGSRYDKEVYR